jgi:hypothetical protein
LVDRSICAPNYNGDGGPDFYPRQTARSRRAAAEGVDLTSVSAVAPFPYLRNAPRKLRTGLIGLKSRRQRLGIEPTDHLIQSLIGEGYLGGLVKNEGFGSIGFVLAVHVLSPDCRDFLPLCHFGSAHEQCRSKPVEIP